MSTPTRALTLTTGEAAEIVTTDGDKTEIRSPRPSPPGSTVRAKVEGVACEFQLKVRNCKKSGEHFLIDGRIQNATRELKTALRGD